MAEGSLTGVKKKSKEKHFADTVTMGRSLSRQKNANRQDIASVGTLGNISFYVKSLRSGKRSMLGLSDVAITSTAQFEEHERNGKKSYLEFISPGLEELSFHVYASAQYKARPLEVKKALDAYRKKGTPNNFVLGGRKIGDSRWVITNLQSDFTVIFTDGRPVAITFSVTLKEYPNRKARKKKVSEKNKKSTKKTESVKGVKKTGYIRYVVKLHDTLWDLAVKFYGSGLKYTKIFNANKIAEKGFNRITDPNKIYVGWVIKIPK